MKRQTMTEEIKKLYNNISNLANEWVKKGFKRSELMVVFPTEMRPFMVGIDTICGLPFEFSEFLPEKGRGAITSIKEYEKWLAMIN